MGGRLFLNSILTQNDFNVNMILKKGNGIGTVPVPWEKKPNGRDLSPPFGALL